MDTQPKTEPKRSQLLTADIAYREKKTKENKIIEKAIENNKNNITNAWLIYQNK